MIFLENISEMEQPNSEEPIQNLESGSNTLMDEIELSPTNDFLRYTTRIADGELYVLTQS